MGVSLYGALGLAGVGCGVGGEAVGSFAKLANLIMPTPCCSIPRLRMQRLVSLFAALREQGALGLAGAGCGVGGEAAFCRVANLARR